jgi:heptosyltransferase-3
MPTDPQLDPHQFGNVRRILVHRLGSIGDFVVSIPCFHLIRRRFPGAEIHLLTNCPIEKRAAPAVSILDGSGLVDQYTNYPLRTRNIGDFYQIYTSIRKFHPDIFIYLVSRPSTLLLVRDFAFFGVCGIRKAVGFPFSPDLRRCRPPIAEGDLWEAEASRLARCLAPLGDAQPHCQASWDLCLTEAELAEAARLLGVSASTGGQPPRLLGFSVGTKQPIKDWGDRNWRFVLEGARNPDLGLVMVGAEEEFARSEQLAKDWPGPVYNFCGRCSPRVSAALIARSELFLCHDSGPMHLAAAVGVRCVAVFSKRNAPGEWFPFGSGHKIFYPPATAHSIDAIHPDQVLQGVLDSLAEGNLRND